MIFYALYAIWGACLAGGAVWAVALIANAQYGMDKKRVDALVTPLISAVISMVTFVCFTLVFIVSRSSNIAQMAQPDGMRWWSFWFHVWPFAFFSNLALLVVAAIFVLLPPYPRRYWQSSLCRLLVLMGIAFSLFHTVITAPDA
jgi:hypothetical protein